MSKEKILYKDAIIGYVITLNEESGVVSFNPVDESVYDAEEVVVDENDNSEVPVSIESYVLKENEKFVGVIPALPNSFIYRALNKHTRELVRLGIEHEGADTIDWETECKELITRLAEEYKSKKKNKKD